MSFAISNKTNQNVRNSLTPPTKLFVKLSSTDSNLAENQDRITDNVWLTRLSEDDVDDGQGNLYNAKAENKDGSGGLDSISNSASPRNTAWILGSWDDIKDQLDKVVFSTFRQLTVGDSDIGGTVNGSTMVMYSTLDMKYYELKMIRYRGNDSPGEMTTIYRRTVSPLVVPSRFAPVVPMMLSDL